mmetsp:Transcript_19287/g.49024  ORF Transcript_19287/g.49024 Transcript_19287/m.49024 type:complete len:161 (-) Transcript_19287:124-606(-)|eukprot:CAMPEP_0177653844 /NCGR_PEP_ID=MMETSP0447-20121125/13967_1 /TAXON_ID=0 /ORGANISM="Stygamoeba regulata, Strain BSH-02190019" /LENGTH=160 /DNA_ID=CAMNT_0019157357 /DNA_START=96 /DNA_END=578 /DNA_ORIENTATION=-
MTIFWHIMSGMLAAECVTILLLCAPIRPIQTFCSKAISQVTSKLNMKPWMAVALVFIAIMMVDAYTTSKRLEEEAHGGQHEHHYQQSLSLRFRNQRNVYISFFCLFNLIVISRLVSIIAELEESKKKGSGSSAPSSKAEEMKMEADKLAKGKTAAEKKVD